MLRLPAFIALLILTTSCTAKPVQPIVTSIPTHIPTLIPADAPPPTTVNITNPASVHCEEQGNGLEIRTASDGRQTGYCIFPDGSECDEWAYFRGECGPASQTPSPTEIPTPISIDPTDYDQGWWKYTHAVYNFSIMLPEDWKVEEITTSDPLLNGHMLNLTTDGLNIRMTFRRVGEDIMLWPTGVGQGEFVEQGTLDVAGQPAQRVFLACPTGEITSIRYHDAEGQPEITRGDLEFGFIFSVGAHCEPGLSLNGEAQRMGEMIIASIMVP